METFIATRGTPAGEDTARRRKRRAKKKVRKAEDDEEQVSTGAVFFLPPGPGLCPETGSGGGRLAGRTGGRSCGGRRRRRRRGRRRTTTNGRGLPRKPVSRSSVRRQQVHNCGPTPGVYGLTICRCVYHSVCLVLFYLYPIQEYAPTVVIQGFETSPYAANFNMFFGQKQLDDWVPHPSITHLCAPLP